MTDRGFLELQRLLLPRATSARQPTPRRCEPPHAAHLPAAPICSPILKGEAVRDSTNDSSQSPGVTSKATSMDDGVKETVKSFTEKLSADLVNVSAKEDLVKQHAKVAEEAVAGWEKAENEVVSLKKPLEAALQQNVNLEVRTSHLDGALKECVRQLRQSKDEHEKRVSDALLEKKTEWEAVKSDLEKQILDRTSQTIWTRLVGDLQLIDISPQKFGSNEVWFAAVTGGLGSEVFLNRG
ncbi:hypothetical protein CASFOL_023272 [Castilleja foliolosa]|uniref:MICOS complex subunit MIC60 n=1 Tax=Castilleja foliolosa TaxID=1961234 RepID=A0ABD3CKY3_9LAMI